MKYLFATLFLLVTNLSAEPITAENAHCYRLPLYINALSEPTITRFRGGISRQQDSITSVEIIKNLIRRCRPYDVLQSRINAEADEIAQRLINNVDSFQGFDLISGNDSARRMYITLCARVLLSNQALTESGCLSNAHLALAAAFRR